MQRLIPIVVAGGAFAVALALLIWLNSGGSTGGTDPGVVARRAIQASIEGNKPEWDRLVRTQPAFFYPSVLRGCEIADVKIPADVLNEPVRVVFQTPCGTGTRTIACQSVSLELLNERYYVSSFGNC